MNCSELRNRMHAYLDGELGLLLALAAERHLLACPNCRQMHAQHTAARLILRGHATCFAAPPALHAEVEKAIAKAALPPPIGSPRSSWLSMPTWPVFGGALVFTVVATWTISTQMVMHAAGDRLPDQIVASHARALMSKEVTDLASSNPTKVHLWLSGKLGYSPRVEDHTQGGYSLAG